MKKIGLVFCLLLILLTNVKADTSKDIMVKYECTDNTSKYTKEMINNKVEYELNEDKVKISLRDSKNIDVLFFEVSTDSLQWLKSKVDINKEANVYYFKMLNNSNNITSNIKIEEYSGIEKKITIYDENGNKIQKIKSDCYVVVEKLENEELQNNNSSVYEEHSNVIEKNLKNIKTLIIFIVCIFIILIIIKLKKLRKDKK